MANTIIELRRSHVSGNVPTNLANGEIAINTYDGKLFYRGGVSNTIQTIERFQGPAGLNQEIQFNDSGVLGADSGLTYNKTTDTLTTKNVSSNLVSIRTNGIVPIELFSDNTVSSFQYTGKSFSVSGQESGSTGIHFKPDGTKMFVIGSTGDDINEYALSTPWEITTATFTRVTAALTDTSPSALRFSSDGLSAYVLGDTNDRIYQHTLTEAWNVATLNTTATNTFTVTSQEATPTGLAFNPTGTKMFVVGTTGDDINEYDLSTAGNVATATFVQTGSLASPSGSTADTAPGSVDFSADGTRLFVSGTTGEEINEYVLSTPFNVSTIKWVSYKYTGFESADPTGIFLALSNNFFYIVSSSGDAVYQYATNANSLIANTHNLNIRGNVSIDYDQEIIGRQFVQGAHTVYGTSTLSTTSVSGTLTGSSTLSLTGATNSTTLVGTSATTGDMRIGGSTQTGEITIGFSTQNQTLNIANGATTSTNTKTVYIGAAGLSGSQTNVIIGSTISGSRGNTHIFTPNVLITAANTAQTSIRILGGQASISNSTGTIIVNGGVGVNGSIYADAIYDGGVEIIGFSSGAFNTANAAFAKANTQDAINLTQNNSITAAFTAANAATATDTTQNNSITAAFTAANSAGVYANGAFTQANSNYTSAVTKLDVTNSGTSAYLIDQYTGNNPSIYVSGGETIAFNLNVTGHPFVIRESSGGANTSNGLTHVSTTGVVSTGASAQGYVTGVLYWKVPFSLVGSTYVYQCTIHGGMVGNIVIQQPASFVAANTALAFNTANAAFLAANAATATDTTQNNSITAAFAAANAATATDTTQNNSITAAFAAANTATATNLTQNNSITAAFTRANNSLDANNGGTVTGTITATSFITTGSFGNILGANTIYANNFVANTGFIQFADGSKQFTANAGSGGGGTTDQYARNTANAAFIHANSAFDAANTGGGGSANSFGQIVANVGTILATTSNDSLQIVGESGISVSSNVSAKKVIVSVPAGFTFTTADYGFVTDSTNVIYDYGTL